uniref:RUN domain-containing protein n=1 Tax=Caenorhabditis tropicalis TaxID=1561998 RepID=A0A1I7TSH2_9PELO
MYRLFQKHSSHMTPAPVATAAQKQKQEKIRSDLQKELDNVVKAAIASPHSRRENVPSEITQNLCNSIEAIFIHGLRDPFFLKGTRYAKYPEPNFWPFVSKFSHRSITNQISCLGQVRTEIGKSRAWIRIVLNENALSQYLDLLATESTAIQQFYSEEAFLRLLLEAEHSERIRGLLKPLTSLPLSAATNSSFLNTWTPTPLILAGLMDGEPLKVGVLKARPNPKPAHLTEEIAIPAIDALVPEEDHDIGSPAYLERKRRRALSRPIRITESENDDHSDSSSVYSHPSMLDSGEMTYQHAVLGNLRRNPSSGNMRRVTSNQRIQLPQSPLFSSTPVDTTILDQVKTNKRSSDFVQVVSEVAPDAPAGYQPIIISRRIRRPSKNKTNSRSSSESASRDSTHITEAIPTRDSRANSDLPSTIFGTVPNDVAFSPDLHEIQSKPISTTIDSGIAELASSSAGGTRTMSEVEPSDFLEEQTGLEERSVSFLDALHKLTTSVDEEVPPPRSLSLTDDCLSQEEKEQTKDSLENTDAEDDREVFDVSMDPEEGTSVTAAPSTSEPVVTRSQPMTIRGGSRRQLVHIPQQKLSDFYRILYYSEVMRIRTISPLVYSTDMNIDNQVVATTSVFDTMTPEEEEEAFERLRSLSKRLSSSYGSVGGRRRSSLTDVVFEVNRAKDSFFRKFVNSTLNLVTTMRKEEKRSVKQLFCDVTDSILGTSLRDELMGAMSTDTDTFENGVPIYVQSPGLMGNSLAAIGARHQMWESRSDHLSSSSESEGPVVSFGQALRSAMETRKENGNQMTESLGASSQELNEDVVEESDSTNDSRKSSISADIADKLCRISREKGLDKQDFRCAMCRKTIGGSTFSKFETCAIDSKYYCTECMKAGGKVSIPARVVMDWDWKERAVSDRGRSWYEANQEKALINIKTTNPRLYTHVPALEETRKLREKLHLVSMYLFTCRESVADDFRRRLWPKEYLRSDIDLYSFADLMDVKSGSLQRRLNHLLKHSINHVMSCTLCKQKGFCCELCTVNEVIYPFNTENTHRCQVCFSVFHVECWRTSGECPKCIRRQNFETRRAQADDPNNTLLVLQP